MAHWKTRTLKYNVYIPKIRAPLGHSEGYLELLHKKRNNRKNVQYCR